MHKHIQRKDKLLCAYIKDATRSIRNKTLRSFGKPLKPKWLWFGVTDKCNSHCKHCNIWKMKPTSDALTPEEIEKTLSDPLFNGLEYIINSGGEPVLRNDMEEILLIEHRVLPKATLQLSTNGLLPDRVMAVVKSALEHGVKLDVGVSLDGIAETHDLIRGVKGNFERADRLLHDLAAIKRKHGNRLSVTIGFTLSSLTCDSFKDVSAYAEKLDTLCLPQWFNESQFYSNFGKDLSSKGKVLEVVQSFPFSYLREMWLKTLKSGKPVRFQCFASSTFCVLKCNGDISPCLSLWDVKIGNVREESPAVIWNSDRAEKARKAVNGCEGCLNSWGVGWSVKSNIFPFVTFWLNHPIVAINRLRKPNKI